MKKCNERIKNSNRYVQEFIAKQGQTNRWVQEIMDSGNYHSLIRK